MNFCYKSIANIFLHLKIMLVCWKSRGSGENATFSYPTYFFNIQFDILADLALLELLQIFCVYFIYWLSKPPISLTKEAIKTCKNMHHFSDDTHMFWWNMQNVMTTFDVVYLEMTSTPKRALFAWPVIFLQYFYQTVPTPRNTTLLYFYCMLEQT